MDCGLFCTLGGAGEPLRKAKCRAGKFAQSLKYEDLDLDPRNPREKARHGGILLSSHYKDGDRIRCILGAHGLASQQQIILKIRAEGDIEDDRKISNDQLWLVHMCAHESNERLGRE